MIVRTYGRRSRDPIRTASSDDLTAVTLLDSDSDPEPEPEPEPEPDLSFLSQDPLFNPTTTAFSSQDSSPWAFDPGNSRANYSKTATLMEAQEFGEMMEHVDEVEYALDGLRVGKPRRVRRASLLSLLSICGSAQQRRLLRAQGMAKRIIDAILGLDFNDSPSTIAAAALFFVLASDVEDDHLLDSSPCISFLLKLLSPPASDFVKDKRPNIGSKFLGIGRPQAASVTNEDLDTSSKAIFSKVKEILVSCKEMKSGSPDDEGMNRPELSSKWLSLLTMEKACLSTVSFEDTSEPTRKVEKNFKERLRELGGLDAIFDVILSCHSTLERCLKHKSPSVSEMKEKATVQSVALLLKCLKIMENATFLSKDNQDHLLGMRRKLNSEEPVYFAGVIISSIKFLSGLSHLQSSSSITTKGKQICLSENVDAEYDIENRGGLACVLDLSGAPDIIVALSGPNPTRGVLVPDVLDGNLDSSAVNIEHISAGDVACGGTENFPVKRANACNKRQKMSTSTSELSVSGSAVALSFASDLHCAKEKADFQASSISAGAFSGFNGNNDLNGNGLKSIMSANSLKANSDKGARGWISIRTITSGTNSSRQSKRSYTSTDVEGESKMGSSDPFAFDEDELQPSKWEKSGRKETSQIFRSTVTNKEHSKGYDIYSFDENPMVSQSTNGDSSQSCEGNCPLEAEEDANLLEDCLLASVKVLMNLTNDNPVGCQQIAACGGLDTMLSLIMKHFPSYNLCSPVHRQSMDKPSSSRSTSGGHLNNKRLTDHGLDFLVAILGLLVNLVEKDSRNRLRLASARVTMEGPGVSEVKESHTDVISLLCSIFLASQGAGEAACEGKLIVCDEEALLQGEQEAEMMIIEAYAALLLAFLSTESADVREAIASCLPNHNLEALVPVLEKFVAFHLQLNMISSETYSTVTKVIESCKGR